MFNQNHYTTKYIYDTLVREKKCIQKKSFFAIGTYTELFVLFLEIAKPWAFFGSIFPVLAWPSV